MLVVCYTEGMSEPSTAFATNFRRACLAVGRFLLWVVVLVAFAFAVLSLLLLDVGKLAFAFSLATVLFAVLFFGRTRSRHERIVAGSRAIWLILLTYGAFGLFFWRRHLALTGVDTSHIVAKQAYTVMIAMLLLCLGYYVARVHPVLRAHGKSVAGVVKLLLAFTPFLAVVWRSSQANLPSWCNVANIETGDWLVVALLSTIFILVVEVQERTAHHSRHGLIEKHGHETIGEHLPTRR